MTYKPVWKRPEDEISKKVEEKVRIGIDGKIRNEIDEKLKARVEGVRAEVDEKVNVKIEERFKEESEKVRSEVDSKVKTEVEARVLAILKEKEDKDKSDKANKIAKAVDVAKALKGESDLDKEKAIAAEKEISCPNCHKEGKGGHIHKVETDKSGLVWKCDGDKCGFEAVLVSRDSDYKCVGCGVAIKRPADPKSMDGCPFCGSKKAIRFNWEKLWGIKK